MNPAPPTEAPPEEDPLGGLCRRVRSANPFADDRGDSVTAAESDAAEVHRSAGERLAQLAAESAAARRGFGVVLAGDPGSGKTHVLARLARRAAGDGRAWVVTVGGLAADPDALPAALLESVGGELTGGGRGPWQATRLFRLTHGAVVAAVGRDLRFHPWRSLGRAFAAQAARLGHGKDTALADLLFRFYRSAVRARQGKEDGVVAGLVARYLGGGHLDATQARWLNLPPPRPGEAGTAAGAAQAGRVLAALAALAGADDRPFVLAVDGADALPPEAAATLARILAPAIDSSPGLLAVTAAGTDTLAHWRAAGLAPESAWDRVARFEVHLDNLGLGEAREIVRRRLEAFFATDSGCEALRAARDADPLFPLGATWFARAVASDDGLRPRQVLRRAAEAWALEQKALESLGPVAWLGPRPAVPECVDAETEVAVPPPVAQAPPPAPPRPWEGHGEADVESSLSLQQLYAAIAGRAEPAPASSPAAPRGEQPGYESSLSVDQLRAAIAARPSARGTELRPAAGPEPGPVPPDTVALSTEQLREAVRPAAGPADVAEAGGAGGDAFTPVDLYFGDEEAGSPSGGAAEPAGTLPIGQLRGAAEGRTPREGPSREEDLRRTQPAPFLGGVEPPDFLPESFGDVPPPEAFPPEGEGTPEWQAAVDSGVGAAVGEFLAEFRESPGDAERVADLLHALLLRCQDAYPRYGILQVARVPPWRPSLPACDLDVRQHRGGDGPPLRSGVLVLTSSRVTAVTNLLRRLVEDRHPFDRLFLVTEERVGLPLGPRGQEYLHTLQVRTSHRLYTVELGGGEYAGLAALEAVARQAAAGGLTADDGGGARPVTESAAVASHHRRRRFLGSPLLGMLLFDAPQTRPVARATAGAG